MRQWMQDSEEGETQKRGCLQRDASPLKRRILQAWKSTTWEGLLWNSNKEGDSTFIPLSKKAESQESLVALSTTVSFPKSSRMNTGFWPFKWLSIPAVRRWRRCRDRRQKRGCMAGVLVWLRRPPHKTLLPSIFLSKYVFNACPYIFPGSLLWSW